MKTLAESMADEFFSTAPKYRTKAALAALFGRCYGCGLRDGSQEVEDRCMALLRKWNGVEK